MYYKGIVMEILPHCAILLTEQGNFIKIKRRDELVVGQTVLCVPEDLITSKPKVVPLYKKMTPILITIAACLLFVLMPSLKGPTTYAILSVDVNPSFELELDDTMVIIRVKALNQSAKLLNLDQLTGLSLEEGLQQLQMIFEENQIDVASNATLISLALLAGEDIDYEQKVEESLKLSHISNDMAYLKVTKEELQQAQSQNVSAGKLKAKQLLQNDDIDDLSVNEIIQLFQQLNIPFDILIKNGVQINDDLEDEIEEIIDEIEDMLEEPEDVLEESVNQNIDDEDDDWNEQLDDDQIEEIDDDDDQDFDDQDFDDSEDDDSEDDDSEDEDE